MIDRTKAKSTKGIVYVLTNEALPGIVKIGRTTKTPALRLSQINGYLGTAIDLSPFVMQFYAETKDCVKAEAKMHTLLKKACVERRGLKEFFQVELSVVREALAAKVGPVTDFIEWPWPRPISGNWGSRVPASRGGQRYRGGFEVYVWLRDHYDELKTQMKDPQFSWPRLAYQIGVDVAKPGKPFRPLPPDIVQQVWVRANSAQETFGENPFSVRPSHNEQTT